MTVGEYIQTDNYKYQVVRNLLKNKRKTLGVLRRCLIIGEIDTSIIEEMVESGALTKTRSYNTSWKHYISLSEQVEAPINSMLGVEDITRIHKVNTYLDYRLEVLLDVVCEFYDVDIEDVKGKSRETTAIIPRHVYCYLSSKYMPLETLKSIGKHVNREYSTVISSKKRAQDLMDTDKSFAKKVNRLCAFLESRMNQK